MEATKPELERLITNFKVKELTSHGEIKIELLRITRCLDRLYPSYKFSVLVEVIWRGVIHDDKEVFEVAVREAQRIRKMIELLPLQSFEGIDFIEFCARSFIEFLSSEQQARVTKFISLSSSDLPGTVTSNPPSKWYVEWTKPLLTFTYGSSIVIGCIIGIYLAKYSIR